MSSQLNRAPCVWEGWFFYRSRCVLGDWASWGRSTRPGTSRSISLRAREFSADGSAGADEFKKILGLSNAAETPEVRPSNPAPGHAVEAGRAGAADELVWGGGKEAEEHAWLKTLVFRGQGRSG